MTNEFVTGFNYEESVGKELKNDESDPSSRANFIKLKVGENKIRFLPPTAKCPKLMHKVDLHWVFLNGKKTPILCLESVGQKCPICEDADAHYKIGDKEGASSKRAKTQYLYNVMDADGKLGVLGADKKLANAINEKHKAIQEEQDPPFDFFGAKDGIWMIINKEQVKVAGKAPPFDKENKFSLVASKKNKCPITDEMKATILEGVKDLTTIYTVYTYDELAKKYYGTSEPQVAVTATGPGVATGVAAATEESEVEDEPPLVDDDAVTKFINDLTV
jgi:hypothetical protein